MTGVTPGYKKLTPTPHYPYKKGRGKVEVGVTPRVWAKGTHFFPVNKSLRGVNVLGKLIVLVLPISYL